MNLLDKIGNRSQLIIVALVVFSVFVGLGCISASDLDNSSVPMSINHKVYDKIFGYESLTMSEKYNTGTGYHWELSPESYGIKSMNKTFVVDHNLPGSSATVYFNFVVRSKDYYVQLDYISPSGKIVDSVNSTSVN